MTKIPVNRPVLSDKAKQNVKEALDSGWLSSSGPFVREFEQAFARYLGVNEAVTCTNGTSALHLALLSLGIKDGDEVIVPAFTMAAVWLAVIYTGGKPVFVDCEPETYNIDPKLIEKKISKKTRAIITVHTYGHSADMDPILEIAKRHDLFLIEDAAEAHGALYKGRLCGSIGHIGCFSFYANKILTTGEGGMVVTNDHLRAEEIRRLKDLYHSKEKRFIHENIGFNYRMTNIQAGIGLGELENIDKYVQRKREIADFYSRELSSLSDLILPVEKDYAKSVFWMYAIRIKKRKGLDRDILKKKLLEAGIETRDFFYSPKDQPVLKNYLAKKENFPETELAGKTGLYIPCGLGNTDEELKKVASEIKRILK